MSALGHRSGSLHHSTAFGSVKLKPVESEPVTNLAPRVRLACVQIRSSQRLSIQSHDDRTDGHEECAYSW